MSRWYPDFNPRVDKPSRIPVWVELTDFPHRMSPCIKAIGDSIGNLMGRRPQSIYNQRFDPQLLIEVDLSQPLIEEVDIFDQVGVCRYTQRVLYKNLPNTCFYCYKAGHYVRDCPELAKKKIQSQADEEGFVTPSKKSTLKHKTPKRPAVRKLNRFAALIEEIEDPLMDTASEPDSCEEENSEMPTDSKPIAPPNRSAGSHEDELIGDSVFIHTKEGPLLTPDHVDATQELDFEQQLTDLDQAEKENLDVGNCDELPDQQEVPSTLLASKCHTRASGRTTNTSSNAKRKKEKLPDPRASLSSFKPSKTQKKVINDE